MGWLIIIETVVLVAFAGYVIYLLRDPDVKDLISATKLRMTLYTFKSYRHIDNSTFLFNEVRKLPNGDIMPLELHSREYESYKRFIKWRRKREGELTKVSPEDLEQYMIASYRICEKK